MFRNIFWMTMVLVFMAACGPQKANTNSSPLQKNERVVFLDLVLKNLNYVGSTQSIKESGQLEVRLELENEKNKDIWTDVQVIFENANGVEIERSSWEPYNWGRRTVSQYTKTSLTPEAKSFRVILRKIK